MRVLIINVADTEGGAAIAGYTLCSALNKYTNFKTEILCGDKYGCDDFVHQILPSGKRLIERGINKYLVKTTISQEYLLPYKNFLDKNVPCSADFGSNIKAQSAVYKRNCWILISTGWGRVVKLRQGKAIHNCC